MYLGLISWLIGDPITNYIKDNYTFYFLSDILLFLGAFFQYSPINQYLLWIRYSDRARSYQELSWEVGAGITIIAQLPLQELDDDLAPIFGAAHTKKWELRSRMYAVRLG